MLLGEASLELFATPSCTDAPTVPESVDVSLPGGEPKRYFIPTTELPLLSNRVMTRILHVHFLRAPPVL